MVVTEERYRIAAEMERIAEKCNASREDLMGLVGMAFEAGQRDGLNAYAVQLTAAVNGDRREVTH